MTITAVDIPLQVDEHGIIRVGRSRLPLERIVWEFDQGRNPQEIVDAFDVLSLAEVYAAIGYYLSHRDEVREYIRHRDVIAKQVRRECEALWPPDGLKARLLARQRQQNDGSPA